METTMTTQDVSVRLPKEDIDLLQAIAKRLGWDIMVPDSPSELEKAEEEVEYGDSHVNEYLKALREKCSSEEEYRNTLEELIQVIQEDVRAIQAELQTFWLDL